MKFNFGLRDPFIFVAAKKGNWSNVLWCYQCCKLELKSGVCLTFKTHKHAVLYTNNNNNYYYYQKATFCI